MPGVANRWIQDKAYEKLEYCRSKDLKLSKSAVLLTAVPVWEPRGIKVENSHRPRKTLFRTRRKQVRKNKKVLTVNDAGYYSHEGGFWKVPKVGRIEARKLLDEGLIPRSFQVIERPGDTGRRRWRVNAVVLLRVPAPVSRDDIVENIVEHGASRVLGVDLGVNIPAMFSNGDSLMYVERIQELTVEGDRLKKKKMSACRRQSRGWQQNRSAYRKTCAQIRQIKLECIWAGMRKVCADNDVVVFEKLNIVGMRKSAKGTMETPGSNVGAKAGLNRELGRVSWGTIIQICRAAAKFTGTRVIMVDAKNSSRECASCGHIAAGNRETQPVFCCLACGYSTNADLNASVVIERRGTNHILEVAGVVLPQGRMGSGSGIPPVRARATDPTHGGHVGSGLLTRRDIDYDTSISWQLSRGYPNLAKETIMQDTSEQVIHDTSEQAAFEADHGWLYTIWFDNGIASVVDWHDFSEEAEFIPQPNMSDTEMYEAARAALKDALLRGWDPRESDYKDSNKVTIFKKAKEDKN